MKKVILIIILLIVIIGAIVVIANFDTTENIQNNNNLSQDSTENNINNVIENSCKTNCICSPGTKRKCSIRNQVPGSISFVPSVAGLIIAGEIIKDIIQ